ncbi:hypothetical protein M0802_004269 [Mischocyttarus mexicanus]|nr:hypothetical protein M0802_004269 [Mischocyttarus mexicanus]
MATITTITTTTTTTATITTTTTTNTPLECLYSRSPDYSKGIFQSIGFKEFHDYLILPEEERVSKKGEEMLNKGRDYLKLVTRRYARTQQKWIRNPVSIISAVLRGDKPDEIPINENVKDLKTTDSSNEVQNYCEICERIFIGEFQWLLHIKGMKHKKQLQRKRKLEEQNLASGKPS